MKEKHPYFAPTCESVELQLKGILAASGEFEIPGSVPGENF